LFAQLALITAATPIAKIDVALLMLVYRKWLLAKSSKLLERKSYALPVS
jgi:hypothetical protein